MARIKDASVEAVKQAADIVTLVEGYTRLRKSGSRLVGLCPFHQEKTPSFGVSPDRGTFKCFGCGEGGDAIAFVEKQENLDFVGAIEWLADRFGVRLEYEETSPAQDQARKRRERLFQVLDRAATFYERYLWESEAGGFARDYLSSRGLGEEIARDFRLGLAPGGTALVRAAAENGFTRDDLAGAGLVNRRGNDYFARRLLFPLADARGRVRGFQARKLREDDPLRAKYVNSPEGDLFRKGDLLYGLDHSRAAIAKQDRAVVVEGNTDVLALRQAGFEPVVASMGTALTEQQLKELGAPDQASLALLRRRCRGAGRNAARNGAGHVAGLRHPRRLARRRHRPCRRPRGLRAPAGRRGGLPAVPRPHRDRPRVAGPATCVRTRPRSPQSVSRVARAPGCAETRGGPAWPAARAPGRLGSGCSGPEPARSRRRCSRPASGWSATRSPA